MRLILLRGKVPINFPPLRRGGQGHVVKVHLQSRISGMSSP